MSYILDALRKSESERRKGRVPDLNQQVHIIHKPKKTSSLPVWIGAGLILNAAVLALVFWPNSSDTQPVAGPGDVRERVKAEKPAEPAPADNLASSDETSGDETSLKAAPQPAEATTSAPPVPIIEERPTVIVPSRDSVRDSASQPVTAQSSGDYSSTVPHLVEMPLAFQESIPDLVFNSHIYASEPSSRRVMINSNYLKAGERFSGIRVERITEEGVVLSKDGRPFRVGVVRDWMSPK